MIQIELAAYFILLNVFITSYSDMPFGSYFGMNRVKPSSVIYDWFD